MNQTVRVLSVVLAVGAVAGCVSVKDVTHHVERGNPIVHEGPKLEGVVYDANVASGEGTVDVQLTPATCVSESRTPVTTTEVTTTRISRAGSVRSEERRVGKECRQRREARRQRQSR